MGCIKTSTASLTPLDSPDNGRTYKVIFIDLQLFNEEKTEEATPKRKQEARSKGQVARSTEVNSAFIILVAFLTLNLTGAYMYEQLAGFMRNTLSNLVADDLTIASISVLTINFMLVFLKTALPLMFAILVASLAANFLQVGFVFSFEPLMPKLEKINPINGFGRIFSKRSLVELAKSIIKIAIIGYFIYRFIIKEIVAVPQLIGAELVQSFKITGSLVLDLVFQISLVMMVLAAVDYFYQLWEHQQSLKMSKYEIKQEYKQTEGNPQIKGKIREKQRSMAMRRMMQEVPKADVVVTNPTHFAVALKYEKEMVAPIVVAKGQDFIAERIKETAKNNRVTIVENKPLARALYSSVDIGDTVPPELYKAVAEVLAYVYRLKKRLS